MSIVTFCTTYLGLSADLAWLGKVFLIAALAVAIATALVEVIAKLRPAPTPDNALLGQAPLKDVVTALKDLVTALATAPIWLGLFAVGTTVFWVAGSASPDQCRVEKLYAPGEEEAGEQGGNVAAPDNAAETNTAVENTTG